MVTQQEQTFAICFGNRFFFPEHLIAIAREEMTEAVSRLGYKSLIVPPDAIPNGAVGTTEDGVKFSIMDVFCQCGLPFTTFPPPTPPIPRPIGFANISSGLPLSAGWWARCGVAP